MTVEVTHSDRPELVLAEWNLMPQNLAVHNLYFATRAELLESRVISVYSCLRRCVWISLL